MSAPAAVEETFLSRLEAIFRSHPASVAAKSNSRTLTYSELDELSARCAGALQRRSEGRVAPVALMLEDNVSLIVAMIGVLRSGGFYFVPNSTLSGPRSREVFEQVRPWAIITDQRHGASEVNRSAELFMFDALVNDRTPFSAPSLDEKSPLAVFYTSGSTGKPRPLIYTHGGTMQAVVNYSRSLGVSAGDRLTLLSPCSAAASISSIFGALLNGASLFPFDPIAEGLTRMRDWIETNQITIYHSVPTLFRRFAATLAPGELLQSIRVVKLGGESAFLSDVDLFRAHFRDDAILVNGLGLTEANGNACHFHIRSNTKITAAILPVGQPLPGIEMKVIDSGGKELAPRGVGQIALRGKYVAPGFWDGMKIQPHPLNEAGWFHTGDLGRQNSGGVFEHLGRQDDQLKISGRWVSPGEIEAALMGINGVRQAAAVVCGGAAEKKIVAFVSPSNGAISPAELRSALQRCLSSQQLPHRIFNLSRLPLLANGKIDRMALLREAEGRLNNNTSGRFPHDPVAFQLTRIWQNILETSDVSVTDDFFALGGDSLAAATMLAAVEKFFGVHLPVSAMTDAATIEKLAALIRDGGWSESDLRLIGLQLRGTQPALYCIPGAGSEAIVFRDLAARLGRDQLCFAFQPPGLDGCQTFPRSIGEIAEYYLDALRKHQPHGPYYLCGSSFGGVVAFEMAQRLIAQGEKVPFLALLDTYAGDYPRVRDGLSLAQKLKVGMQRLVPVAQRDDIDLRALCKGAVDWVRRKIANLDLLLNFRRRPLPYRVRFLYLQEVCFAARRDYQLRPFAGKIHLFRVAHQPSRELFEDDPFLGWTGIAKGGTEVHDLPGRHGQHLREPNVAVLAQQLRIFLGRKTGRTSGPLQAATKSLAQLPGKEHC